METMEFEVEVVYHVTIEAESISRAEKLAEEIPLKTGDDVYHPTFADVLYADYK